MPDLARNMRVARRAVIVDDCPERNAGRRTRRVDSGTSDGLLMATKVEKCRSCNDQAIYRKDDDANGNRPQIGYVVQFTSDYPVADRWVFHFSFAWSL